MRVCVIGAGIVGCASAYQLSNAGHEVLLLDAAPGPGCGTSFANGAQLSYSYVQPLASPSVLRGLPAMLLDPASPLRFRPRWDLAQWQWGLRFLANCTTARSRAGTRALIALAQLSRSTLEHWMEQDGFDMDFRRNGKLVLCPDEATLDQQAAQSDYQAYSGIEQYILGRDACIAQEPALAAYKGFVGGVWTPSECSADPYRFCQELVRHFLRRGGRTQFGARAIRFEREGGRACGLHTSAGFIAADAFVLATGHAGRALARGAGESLPLYPVKGYSLTLKIREGRVSPRTSVTDLGRKTVVAPIRSGVRVAAMAEVIGDDLSIPPARVAAMRETVESMYPGLCDWAEPMPWAGLRPCTPDSVPIVRVAAGADNVVLNLGHGALGLTLAAGCARQVQAICGRLPSVTGSNPGRRGARVRRITGGAATPG